MKAGAIRERKKDELRVAYVTMQFPKLSETFASNDVRTLLNMGIAISVYGLRLEHPEAKRLLAERDLGELRVTHATFGGLLRGALYGLRHPGRLLELLTWLWRATRNDKQKRLRKSHKRHFEKSLVLLPRALEIFSRLEQARPDVVHLYWGHYPSLVGYLVARFLPDTVLSMSLGPYDLGINYGGSRSVAQQADVVKTLARVNVPRIVEQTGVPAHEITVIYNSLDLQRVRHVVGHSLLERKVPRRILSAGRLHPDKAMDEVLSAFASALPRHPDATLVILGDGAERGALEKQCDELGIRAAVTFLGHVNHDEVFAEMAKAEVFLFLSKEERLPNVVKEAMLCECLCIVSRTIGIEELLPDERYGHVVAVGDKEGAARHLKATLDHPETRAPLLEQAKAHVLEHFNVEQAMARQVGLWREAIAKRRKRQVPASEAVLEVQGA